MGHALANTVMEFGIARFCLGLGESGNFPAAIKTVAEWFPQSERSLATGIFNSGANVGAILAPLLVPWVTIHYGWHAAFLVTGVFSASWILLWFLKYRKPAEHPTLGAAELQLHRTRESPKKPGLPRRGSNCSASARPGPSPSANSSPIPSGGSICSGCLPTSPQRFHLDLSHLGLPLIIVYNCIHRRQHRRRLAAGALRQLGLSRRQGAPVRHARSAPAAWFPSFCVNYIHSEWVAMALLSLAAAAHQGWSANLFTTTSDMFPRSAVGSVTGIGGMAGSVGGILLATYSGFILQMTHSYATLFVIAASAYLTALADHPSARAGAEESRS